MPSWIVGAVKASDMTTIFPLAVYAAVQRKLGKKLAFPGDTAAWEKIMPMSSAVLDCTYLPNYGTGLCFCCLLIDGSVFPRVAPSER